MLNAQVVVVTSGSREAIGLMRSMRSGGVFCTLAKADAPEIPQEAKAIVLIDEKDAPSAEVLRELAGKGLPMLAFGAPAGALCEALGGSVTGPAFAAQVKDVRFANMGICAGVDGGMRMVGDMDYLKLPEGARTLSMAEGAILGFEDESGRLSAFQFMPEAQDIEVSQILEHFLLLSAGVVADYTCEQYAEMAVEEIRAQVGDGHAICLLSGGVDSTTAAALARKAVGDRLHCIVIDTGLNRPGEIDSIVEQLGDGLGFDICRMDAADKMMDTLYGCITPQQKRHAVTVFLAARLADEAVKLNKKVVVVQGTNYLERMQAERGLMDMPGDIAVVRPLELLFKDEIRQIARGMGIPEEVVQREHYPSAGVALRCMGAVDEEKLDTLRRADAILRQTLEEAGQNRAHTQAFAVLADISDLFMAEEERYVVILRAVTGVNRGNASVQRLPQDVLERAAERILGEVDGVCRVVFDLTPGKIEWE